MNSVLLDLNRSSGSSLDLKLRGYGTLLGKSVEKVMRKLWEMGVLTVGVSGRLVGPAAGSLKYDQGEWLLCI